MTSSKLDRNYKRKLKYRDKLYNEYLKDKYDRASKENTYRRTKYKPQDIEKINEDNDYGQDYF